MYETAAICGLCPKRCHIPDGSTGFCGARYAKGDLVLPLFYGKLSSLALDPIEKKPLAYFHPGSQILSAGSLGCNMNCLFCQNYHISKTYDQNEKPLTVLPEDLVETALKFRSKGNIGIAFTYNEPLINFEYVRDTAKLAKRDGLETVLVTNGQINRAYLEELLPYISAWNIDLKAFSESTYKDKLSGDLKTALDTLKAANDMAHVEVTTLVVPGISDDIQEFKKEVDFLSGLEPKPVLHLTRYFPRYKYNAPATSKTLLEQMLKIAEQKLDRVKLGNI